MNKKKVLVIIMFLIGVLLVTGCSNRNDPELISFKDDFSSPDSGWSTSTYDNANYYYNNDNYAIKVNVIDKLYRATAPIDKLSSEYTVKVDVLHKTQEGHLGIVFNKIEDGELDDYYVFRFRPYTQEYKVSRNNEISGDGWTNIMSWESYNTLNEKNNTLKLVQNKDNISLYLNGNLLKELSGIQVNNEGIEVGLFVSSLESDDTLTDSVIGIFDNFEVSGYAF